ncbi:MAG: hypothetical protein ACTSSI_15595 [Candidatus Helarchaeota archaeon]
MSDAEIIAKEKELAKKYKNWASKNKNLKLFKPDSSCGGGCSSCGCSSCGCGH